MDEASTALLEEAPALLDATDPLTIALTWGLTWGAGKVFNLAGNPGLRRALPIVAVLAALAVRTVISAVSGSDFTWEILGRALIDAAIAVLGHSQFRELLKVIPPPESKGGEA